MYAITGATGNTGSKIAEHLLAEGKKIRVIGRNAEKLQPLVDKGAEALTGSLEDQEFVNSAFRGAFAVYAMIPSHLTAENFRAYQNRVGEVLANVLKVSGIEYVVNLSSLGAHLSEGTGPILGLYDQEQRLNQLKGLNVVHLRPTYFMENLFANIPLIKSQGFNGGPLKADVSFPMIATKDIVKVAVEYLMKLDFKETSIRELLGQRDLSMNEITQIIGKAIEKPDLSYVQVPYDAVEQYLVQAGLSPDMARLLIELNRSINEGSAITGTPRTEENTTETSFEEFAETTFAPIYKSS